MKRGMATFTYPDDFQGFRIIRVMALWVALLFTHRAKSRFGNFSSAKSIHKNDLGGTFFWVFFAMLFNRFFEGSGLSESRARCTTLNLSRFCALPFPTGQLVAITSIIDSHNFSVTIFTPRIGHIPICSPGKFRNELCNATLRTSLHRTPPYIYVDNNTTGNRCQQINIDFHSERRLT